MHKPHSDQDGHDHKDHDHSGVTESDENEQEGLRLAGLDCADCAVKLERSLSGTPGVSSANVSFAASKMNISYDPDQTSLGDIEKQIQRLGYDVVAESGPVSKSRLTVGGMDCADCADTVRKSVALMPGIFKARLDIGSAILEIEHDKTQAPLGLVVDQVSKAGYIATPLGDYPVSRNFWYSIRTMLTIWSTAMLLVGAALSLTGFVGETTATIFYALAMVIAGTPIARSGFYAIRTKALDINFLMTVAAIGAAAIGEWAEGATILVLYSIGNSLQAYSLDRTRQAIQSLMGLAPLEALVRRDGTELKVAVEEVLSGETIIVRPGENIPLDGIVDWGSSSIDQSTITGESVMADKHPGDTVYAGTVNHTGALDIKVTETSDNSTLSHIIRLVEEAQSSRAPSQQFIDRFARIYTPAVVGAAVAVAVIPTLLGGAFDVWLYRALALLIISCPCALVISTPVSLVAAIGAATRSGVLIKDGAALEALGTLDTLAFDKTGTLTLGQPLVTAVRPYHGYTTTDVLSVAASVEQHTTHPIARAIVAKATGEGTGTKKVEGFKIIPGMGAEAVVDEKPVIVGKTQLFEGRIDKDEIPGYDVNKAEAQGETVILVGNADQVIGIISLLDSPRADAADTIKELSRVGIGHTIMLTGDNAETAAAIGKRLGIKDVRAGLLPDQKVGALTELQAKGIKVGIVGDGINDAPAIAVADVGIAMGAAGSDIALDTSDVALLSDDLSKIPYAIDLSKRTLRIIKQNVFIAVATKAIFLLLAPFGLITLWLAVLADTGVSLLVTANGMRLFRTKNTVRK